MKSIWRHLPSDFLSISLYGSGAYGQLPWRSSNECKSKGLPNGYGGEFVMLRSIR